MATLFFCEHGNRNYIVREDFCPNPDCTSAHLEFMETDDSHKPLKDGRGIVISLDMKTWKHTAVKADTADDRQFIKELIAALDKEDKAGMKKRWQEHSDYMRSLLDCTIDPKDVRKDREIPYGELPYCDRRYLAFRLEDAEYLVDDAYCCNPDCDCLCAYVTFHEAKGPARLELMTKLFKAQVGFDGMIKVQQTFACEEAEAKTLVDEWLSTDMCLFEVLRGRYEAIKEIGEASLANAGEFGVTKPITVTKVGRNSPCPCGSGKKYKKCCGR